MDWTLDNNEASRTRATLQLDYTLRGRTRCYIDCPETGYLREVDEVRYKDGGVLLFPTDFSSCRDAQHREKALS